MLAVVASAAEGAAEKEFPLTPLGFGVAGFVVLMLLLWIVTRFNPDR
jgi:hypothetical protein